MSKNIDHVIEVLPIIKIIEENSFDALSGRRRFREEYCPCMFGRIGVGADNMYYNIHSNRVLYENEVYLLAQADQSSISDGHTHGWKYNQAPECWVGGDGMPNTFCGDRSKDWLDYIPIEKDVTCSIAVNSDSSTGNFGTSPSNAAVAPNDTANDTADRDMALSNDSSAAERNDVMVGHKFFVKVGSPMEKVNGASEAELWGYLRNCLNVRGQQQASCSIIFLSTRKCARLFLLCSLIHFFQFPLNGCFLNKIRVTMFCFYALYLSDIIIFHEYAPISFHHVCIAR